MPTKRARRTRNQRPGDSFGERVAKPWESGAIFGPEHWCGGLPECLDVRDGQVVVLMYASSHNDPAPLYEPLTRDLLADYEAAFGTVKDVLVQSFVEGQVSVERVAKILEEKASDG